MRLRDESTCQSYGFIYKSRHLFINWYFVNCICYVYLWIELCITLHFPKEGKCLWSPTWCFEEKGLKRGYRITLECFYRGYQLQRLFYRKKMTLLFENNSIPDFSTIRQFDELERGLGNLLDRSVDLSIHVSLVTMKNRKLNERIIIRNLISNV